MRRIVLGVLAVAAAFTLVGLGRYFYWTEVEHRFLTITEGQLYRSGQMPPAELQDKVREVGIRSVIDLREAGEDVDAERAALAEVGVAHYHVPSHQVPTADVVERYLELLEKADRPLLVHCEHGIGRAVLFSAIYRMEYEGWDNERARSTSFWQSGLGSKFESEEPKGIFLLEYEPTRGSGR